MEIVYFFRETGRPYVKIGMSKNDIQERFKSFKTYAPLGAYIVGYIKTNDSLSLEKKIHEKYKEKRLQGEFFNLTDDEIYNEINLHDFKFGQILSLTNELIDIYNFDQNKLKKDLSKILNKNKEKYEKYEIDDFLRNYLEKQKGKLMSNNMILKDLNDLGFSITQNKLGLILKKNGYKQKIKKINNIVYRMYIL